jgi:hypothetical protein
VRAHILIGDTNLIRPQGLPGTIAENHCACAEMAELRALRVTVDHFHVGRNCEITFKVKAVISYSRLAEEIIKNLINN